jgi:hypothetical protein
MNNLLRTLLIAGLGLNIGQVMALPSLGKYIATAAHLMKNKDFQKGTVVGGAIGLAAGVVSCVPVFVPMVDKIQKYSVGSLITNFVVGGFRVPIGATLFLKNKACEQWKEAEKRYNEEPFEYTYGELTIKKNSNTDFIEIWEPGKVWKNGKVVHINKPGSVIGWKCYNETQVYVKDESVKKHFTRLAFNERMDAHLNPLQETFIR